MLQVDLFHAAKISIFVQQTYAQIYEWNETDAFV